MTNHLGFYNRFISPYSRIQPFTYRDARTFISELEDLRHWVTHSLVGHIDDTFARLTQEIVTAIDEIIELMKSVDDIVARANEVNEKTEALATTVNALVDNANATLADITRIQGEISETQQEIADALDAALSMLDEYRPKWANIDGKPATYPPSAHTHAAADTTTGTFAAARLPDATGTAKGAVTLATPANSGVNDVITRQFQADHLRENFTRRLAAPGQDAIFIGASNVVVGTWTTKVCEHFNWNEKNYAVGGTGFVSGPVQNQWRAQADRAIADYPGDAALKVGIIFVAGGGVDAINNNLAIESEADYVHSALAEKFPYARIVSIPGIWRHIRIRSTILEISDKIRASAAKYGWQIIWGAFEWLYGNREMMTEDAEHPNNLGNIEIARYVIEGLNGGNTRRSISGKVTPNGVWNASGTYVTQYVDNGTVSLNGYFVRTSFTDAEATEMICHMQTPAATPARDVFFQGESGGSRHVEFWTDGAFVRGRIPSGVNWCAFSTTYGFGR